MRKNLLLFALLFVTTFSFSQTNTYLRFTGGRNQIIGETTDPGFKGYIEALNITSGITMPVSSTGAGKPVFSDITFSKYITQNTPLFNANLATGEPFDKVEIAVTKDDPMTGDKVLLYAINLYVATLTSVATAIDGTCNNCKPGVETYSLTYQKIEWIYRGKTEIRKGYDVIGGKSF